MPGLLVADDAKIIRSTIARVVAREGQLDLFPVVQACNGEEAVELARQMKPDVMLMDIKMPGLDGLQAATIIRAECPESKLIILTAYDEFPYVQEALKLGAVDFLLKPVRPANLVELLKKIQIQIRQEQAQIKTVAETRNLLEKALPVVEAGLIESLISGLPLKGISYQDSLNHLGKTLCYPVVLVARINRFGASVEGMKAAEIQNFYKALTEIVRQALPEPNRSLVGFRQPGRIIAIFSTDQELTIPNRWRELGQTISLAIKNEISVKVTVGIGNRSESLESIPRSYAEAGLASRYHIDQDECAVVLISDVQKLHRAKGVPYPVQIEHELLDNVRLGQSEISVKRMNDLIDHLMFQSTTSPDVHHSRLVELMTLVSRATIEAGGEAAEVLDLSHRQLQALAQRRSPAEIRSWALNSLMELMATIHPVSSDKDSVQQAIEYIHENYDQSDISLKYVANAVNLSTSHLAFLLKERLGTSYVKYLTTLRIEQAKNLLRTTDNTVAAIAYQVGYPNPTNFYRLFRRETGMTPAVYRQSVQ